MQMMNWLFPLEDKIGLTGIEASAATDTGQARGWFDTLIAARQVFFTHTKVDKLI